MLKTIATIFILIQLVLFTGRLINKLLKNKPSEVMRQPAYILVMVSIAALFLTFITYRLDASFWWVFGIISVFITQILVFMNWKNIKLSTIPNIIILIAVIFGFSIWSFENQVKHEKEALFRDFSLQSNYVYEEMLEELPSPVTNWLMATNIVGKEMIQIGYLEQSGSLRLEPDQDYADAYAIQFFNLKNPGFLWKVETSLMGFRVVGRDLYNNSGGEMLIKFLGLIPVVNESGGAKLNEATMQRFLGEIVWFPTTALSDFITWEEIDDYSAVANMTYQGVSTNATFHFTEEYELDYFETLRFKDMDDDYKTPWQARVLNHKEFNGIKVPNELEVSWEVDGNNFVWYKFEVTDLKYNNEVPLKK